MLNKVPEEEYKLNNISFKGHIRNNCVNCTKDFTEEDIPIFMSMNVFVKQCAVMIVRFIFVIM